MRPLVVVLGAIVVILGSGWALQGAYILPATFMRGDGWIAIGAAVALFGLAVVFLGIRRPGPAH